MILSVLNLIRMLHAQRYEFKQNTVVEIDIVDETPDAFTVNIRLRQLKGKARETRLRRNVKIPA